MQQSLFQPGTSPVWVVGICLSAVRFISDCRSCVSDVFAITGIMLKISMQHHGTCNTSFMVLIENIPDSSSPLKLNYHKRVIKIMKLSGCREFCMDRKVKGNVPGGGWLWVFVFFSKKTNSTKASGKTTSFSLWCMTTVNKRNWLQMNQAVHNDGISALVPVRSTGDFLMISFLFSFVISL